MESKSEKALGFFKDIPGWAKGVIIILIIAIVAWVVYKFVKAAGFKTEEEREKEQEIKKDKDMFIEQGQKPSYSRTWYRSAADKLYGCGAGQRFGGTDESCIYAVFVSLKNDLDLTLLFEAFGERRKGFSLTDANLGGWLADELNREELAALNNILARRKIKYRF